MTSVIHHSGYKSFFVGNPFVSLFSKSFHYSELFWSVFSLILSLRIKSKCGKIRTRITPNTDTIYVVLTSGNFTIASKYLVSWRKQCRWLQCRPVEWDSGKSKWQDLYHESLNSDPTFIKTGYLFTFHSFYKFTL